MMRAAEELAGSVVAVVADPGGNVTSQYQAFLVATILTNLTSAK
jgi:hypothetical protein